MKQREKEGEGVAQPRRRRVLGAGTSVFVATLLVALVLGVVFQTVFWDHPVSGEIAFLLVLAALVVVIIVRWLWRTVTNYRRAGR